MKHTEDEAQDEREPIEHFDNKEERLNAKRARLLAKGDAFYLLIGAMGAVLAGAVYPAWGCESTKPMKGRLGMKTRNCSNCHRSICALHCVLRMQSSLLIPSSSYIHQCSPVSRRLMMLALRTTNLQGMK
jgi:hypothetical protein